MPVLSNMPVGAVLRYLTGNKTLLYPDETADFNIGTAQRHWERMRATEPVDKTYTEEIGRSDEHRVEAGAVPSTKEAAVPETCTPTSDGSSSPSLHEEQGPRLAAPDGSSEDPVIVVDWYSESDPERPYNWSAWKRAGVYFIILYVSTTVYMSAAIYAVAQDGVSEAFGVSATESSLGLALYVLGYGVGPMFLSPPSELPSVGRNTPYLVSMVAYLAVSFPLPSSSNLVTLLVLRFLQGFFGSPTLATGGASLTDISTQFTKPYALYQLAMFALAGPALGITLAGFTVPLMGWRWTFWEVVIITIPGLIFLVRTCTDSCRKRD